MLSYFPGKTEVHGCFHWSRVQDPWFVGSFPSRHYHSPKLVPGLENDPDKGILRGKWAMPAADVEALFERVVSDIISLVLGQINSMKAPATRVLLVGGLGQSSYLRERIRAEVGTTEVLQPQNGLVSPSTPYSPALLTTLAVWLWLWVPL